MAAPKISIVHLGQNGESRASDTEGTKISYDALMKDSLHSAAVDHGLQYNAMYWETGHKTYTSVLSRFTQKFNWEVMDSQLRNLLSFHKKVSAEPFVFYGSIPYFRAYYGHPEVYEIAPLKRRTNFSFFPTGTRDVFQVEQQPSHLSGSGVFTEIFRSAIKVDCEAALNKLAVK